MSFYLPGINRRWREFLQEARKEKVGIVRVDSRTPAEGIAIGRITRPGLVKASFMVKASSHIDQATIQHPTLKNKSVEFRTYRNPQTNFSAIQFILPNTDKDGDMTSGWLLTTDYNTAQTIWTLNPLCLKPEEQQFEMFKKWITTEIIEVYPGRKDELNPYIWCMDLLSTNHYPDSIQNHLLHFIQEYV